MAGQDALDPRASGDRPLAIALEATRVTSHSDKELAAPTDKQASVLTS